MTENLIFSGESRYASIFKGEKFVVKVLCNSLVQHNTLTNIRYVAHLNGHKILDESISRLDAPNYIIHDEGWVEL